MDLTTRCPQCGTIFSASLEQLQLRKGYIRCVECANIFDGYDAVVPGDSVSDGVAPVRIAPAQATPSMPSVLRQRLAKEHSVPVVEPVVSKAAPEPDAGPAFSISAPVRDIGVGQREDPIFKVNHSASESIYIDPQNSRRGDAPMPEFLGGDSRYSGVKKLFWGVLTVAGLLLLLAQLVYVYRAQIANQIPALRPALTQACVSLNCKVAYARHIDQISIMSSSLKTTPEATDASGTMILQMTLRNAYDKPQEWPTLVLELTDFSGTVVVKKNLAPANYLPSEVLQHPFSASSEITVGVPIVLNDLKINGYQLGKFFP